MVMAAFVGTTTPAVASNVYCVSPSKASRRWSLQSASGAVTRDATTLDVAGPMNEVADAATMYCVCFVGARALTGVPGLADDGGTGGYISW